MRDLVLLVPERGDLERDAVARAWEARVGPVLRVGRFWDPPPVEREKVRVYGNDTFCLVLAEKLDLMLVSPDDHLLLRAPEHLLRRSVRVAHLGETLRGRFPIFAKPIIPKQFTARVHASPDTLAEETRGLADDVEVLLSEIVTFEAEARAFVCDGGVRAHALYEGMGRPDEVARFVGEIAATMALPTTCVVDVGRLPDGHWALIEFNATWGAGLNGCEAEQVLEAIVAASGPSTTSA